MAKKIQKKVKAPQKAETKNVAPLPPIEKSKPFSLADFRMQAIILAVLGFLFYANSFSNDYAFDDGIVILKNDYVQQGFSGIPKILSKDAYDSFYRQGNASQQFSGGRYRPLSVITFAVEQQLFGSKEKVKPDDDLALMRHVGNVLLYIFSVLLMLYFLKTFIFKKNPLIAFIASLLFLIHPLHTEVVANVKSRDEIMSFLFIMLTFIYVFRYREKKKKSNLYFGMLYYFLSLLSKEYAITLILFIPMLLYIVKKDSLKESIVFALPFILVAAVYMFIRISAIGIGTTEPNSDVLNNPYKFATSTQKLATKIEIVLIYLRMLFYPSPLSFDYSYNSIPYVNFGNGLVWLSLATYISMIVAAIVLFFKRNILSFAIAFYLLHLLLVSNFILDVGATMGERLVYHSSFGFVIIIAVLINMLFEKIKQPATRKIVMIAVGSLVTLWCGAKVIQRNPEWKNDTILYTTDVKKVPNSALANGDAGMSYYNMAVDSNYKAREKGLIDTAIALLNKAVSIHKTYVNGYLNLGVAYFRLKDYDKAEENWMIAKSLYPNNPILRVNLQALAISYYNDAMTGWAKNQAEAVKKMQKATEMNPDNPDYWYNLGGMEFTLHNYDEAHKAFARTLELDPNNQKAKEAMSAFVPMPAAK